MGSRACAAPRLVAVDEPALATFAHARPEAAVACWCEAMTGVLIAAVAASCNPKPPPSDAQAVDIDRLAATNPAAARDLDALLDARRGRLSQCADPIRTLVRHGEPGVGSVPVVVNMVGHRGLPIAIRSAAVTPRFPPPFDACVEAAILGMGPTIATGDYALDVRWNLCINPQGAP